MISKKGALEMAKEQDTFESLAAEVQRDLAALNIKRAIEKVPTEGEWFTLFNDIAASLRVQADCTRAEMTSEAQLEQLMQESGLGSLFGFGKDGSTLFNEDGSPKLDPDVVTADGPVKLSTTDGGESM